MDLNPDTPVQYVPGVGPKRAELLSRLGILTVRDFLYHVPFRFNDFSVVSDIAILQPGENVTIKARVRDIRGFRTKNGKRLQQATVEDSTGTMKITWFNQPYLLRVIRQGSWYFFSGEVTWFGKIRTIVSPQYEAVPDDGNVSLHTGRLVPVYHETEGVTSKWLRAKIDHLLTLVLDTVPDMLPTPVRTKYALPDIRSALRQVHFPDTARSAGLARKRLAFDELFLLQLTARTLKRQWQNTQHSASLAVSDDELRTFLRSLPFPLTGDQESAVREISGDMSRTFAMNRLLEGDVGAGKTVVAAVAAYIAYRNGYTTLCMAPTQILASQHFDTMNRFLGPLGIPVRIVTGSEKPEELGHTSGTAGLFGAIPGIYVGTHALLTADFSQSPVGLVIVDEQQRFGVDQRRMLRRLGSSGKSPHLLSMTATPIPRTVALTALGNLDLTVISELPKGRKKVKTWVVPAEKRNAAYAWIEKEIADNTTQAFVLCPFIDESESQTSVRAATVEFERLKNEIFPHRTIRLLHGRLKPRDKDQILADFRSRKFDILVTTPVVEVGVDIPYATIMMIEGSDRFGLAQLHQLRGRVGRSSLQSYCLLFTDTLEEQAITRLKSMERIAVGPELAEFDLRLRGPGEVFGTSQHGLPHLKVASFFDTELIRTAADAAEQVLGEDPELRTFDLLRDAVKSATIREISQD